MTGASGVGFAEVRIPGVHVAETIRLPSDLLRALGTVIPLAPAHPRPDPRPSCRRCLLAQILSSR